MSTGLLRCAHLGLPTELVLAVVDHLSVDTKSLCMLARTSRALQHLAEEHIYKTIQLTTVSGLHAIIEAFTYRHQRIRAVQTLKLQYHYNIKELGDNMDARRTFNECVAHMVNLRDWHIESPYDNRGHWSDTEGPSDWVNGDMERFRTALDLACVDGPKEAKRLQDERQLGNVADRTVGLALLESLTIHSHGVDTDFWHLDDFHCLFRHPSLRYLHVSCVSLIEGIPALAPYARQTPLATLIFDECELSPEALSAILRTPARLKHLTLGENVWNTKKPGRTRQRLNKVPAATLDALTNVAHSLESLTHLDPSWKLDTDSYKATRMSPIGEGMRSFHALKYLECEVTSFLHQAFIMNHELAPPSLDTLRLRRHWYVSVDLFDRPPEVETYLALPSLKTLELMQQSHCWHPLSTSAHICDEQHLRARHAYAYKLYKAGINLRVLIRMHRDPHIIPPFLYGEVLPQTACVYDAAEVGFRRHIGTRDSSGLELDATGTVSAEDVPSNKGGSGQESSGVSFHSPPPETDQLGDFHVRAIERAVHNTVDQIRKQFIPHRRLRRAESILEIMEDAVSDDDSDAEFDMEVDDYDDEDVEDDEEMDEDDMGVIFHEQDGELYIEVYGSDTDEDEQENDDAGVDGAVHAGGMHMLDDLD